MRRFRVLPASLLATLLGFLTLGISADTAIDSAPTLYRVIDLGLYGPSAINRRHQIAIREQLLNSGNALSSHPFAALWQSGSVRRLGDAAEYTSAIDINSNGQAVGYAPAVACERCPAATEARLWYPDGRAEGLPDLPPSATGRPANGSEAHAINEAGEIAGWSFGYTSRGVWQRAARWRTGHVEPLGADTGGSSAAFAINDVGDVVGWADSTSSADDRAGQRAVLWPAGASSTGVDVGALNGVSVRSVAHDINNARQIVGGSDTMAGERRAFLWQRGVTSDLGIPGGDTDSEAFAINTRGEAAGTSYKHRCGKCAPRAVRWIAGGVVDLNSEISPDSGWHLMTATDLNDDGCIVGRGTLHGEPRYFLLVPVDAQHAKVGP